jgi:hypothetical protein
VAQLADLIRQEADELDMEAQEGARQYLLADAVEDRLIAELFARLRRVFAAHAGLLAIVDGMEREWHAADAAADRLATETLKEVRRLNGRNRTRLETLAQ